MKIITATAPAVWANYLINGDCSGLNDEDIFAADAWIDDIGAGSPVDCEDAGFIAYHDAYSYLPLGADCQLYTFLVAA